MYGKPFSLCCPRVQHKAPSRRPALATVLHLLLFLLASSSQAEKELTESPATSKRISFPGSSETPPSSKRPKTSEEVKPEQVGQRGLLSWMGGGLGAVWGAMDVGGSECCLGVVILDVGGYEFQGAWGRARHGSGKEQRIRSEWRVCSHRCTNVPTASTATLT